jgi:hypothetical protein
MLTTTKLLQESTTTTVRHQDLAVPDWMSTVLHGSHARAHS